MIKSRFLSTKVDWQRIVIYLILTVFLIACLRISWSLLDDGITIIVAKKISLSITHLDFATISNIFLEKDSGRFRPFYFIAYWLIYLFAGTNVHFFYLAHTSLLIVTTLLIFNLIYSISGSKTGSFIGALLFSCSELNVENWFRLGPQEPFIGLYIAIILTILHKFFKSKKRESKYVMVGISLAFIFLYLTKETGIVILPFILFLFVYAYKNRGGFKASLTRNLFIALVVNSLLSVVVIAAVIYLRKTGSYSSNYSLNSHNMLATFLGYLKSMSDSLYPFFWIFIATFVMRNVHKYLNEEKVLNDMFFWQILSLTLTLVNIFVLLPWGIPLSRYLLPALVSFSIFWGLESVIIINFVSKRWNSLLPIGLSLYLGLFIYNNLFPYLNYYDVTSKGTRNTAMILGDVAAIAPIGANIKINTIKSDATLEPLLEAGYHLANFYNRPDLKVSYLEGVDSSTLSKDTFILTSFVSADWQVYKDNSLSNLNHIKLLKGYDFDTVQYLTIPTKQLLLDIAKFNFDDFNNSGIKLKSSPQSWKLYKAN